MRFAIGFAAGVAAAWAALAVWQRVPEFPDLDAGEVPEIDEDYWLPRRGDRRPQFDDAAADPLRGGCSGFGGER